MSEPRDFYPLNVMYGARNLVHIETDAGAKIGQGVAVCSLPRKHTKLAEALVDAFNAKYATPATPTPRERAETES